MAQEGEAEIAGKHRKFEGPLKRVVEFDLAALTIVGSAWALDIHQRLGLVIFKEQYLALILLLGLIGVFIGIKARKNEPDGTGVPWYDWLALAGSLATCGYIVVDYPRLTTELGTMTPDKWILGAIIIFLVMEATRRVLGWFLVGLALLIIFYARFSHLMPAILEAPNTEWDGLALYLYLDTNAIFGLPLTVFSTLIIAFILFGRVLYALNADKFLTQASLALMGRYRGGSAKVAIAASSLFGTISGSVVSNVVMDGPITIPMMVRTGYRSHIAAAIEALASTGGQIMPPVMGITAFLIADWLGIAYAEVVIAAAVPAVLYYLALFVQVDLEAAKQGLVGLPVEDLPRLRDTMRHGWVFVIPFAVLIYTLIIANWQPGKSAMAAVFVSLAVGMLNAQTRPTLKKVWIAIVETGRTLLDLVVITGIAGIIIGGLQVSGFAFSVSLMLVTLAAGSLIFLLVLTGILSIIMGMGLPTAVIYILLAILVAPSLIDFGVAPISAHLFLFYFGMLSMITPPMCFATFAAATIAGCDFWKAGWAGVRLGIVAYVIPFMFVFRPELLLIGAPLDILLALVTATIGVFCIAAAFAGFLFCRLGAASRVALAAAGLLTIPPPAGGAVMIVLNIAGIGLGAAVVIWQRARASRLGMAA